MSFLLKYLLETVGPEILVGILEELAAAGKLTPLEADILKIALAAEPILVAKTPGVIGYIPAGGGPTVVLFTVTP